MTLSLEEGQLLYMWKRVLFIAQTQNAKLKKGSERNTALGILHTVETLYALGILLQYTTGPRAPHR